MMPAKLHIEPGAPPLNVEGLTSDSRQVGHDFLFAALPGSAADGRAFIGDAIRRGARAILAPTGTTLPDPTNDVALITDDDPRRRLALMAAEFYGEQPDNVAAVTGDERQNICCIFYPPSLGSVGPEVGKSWNLGINGGWPSRGAWADNPGAGQVACTARNTERCWD